MTIKALWEVLAKGTQALIWELLLAAYKAGVDMSRQKPIKAEMPAGGYQEMIKAIVRISQESKMDVR